MEELTQQIFEIKTAQEFETVALSVFRHQFENNNVYRSFCDLLYKHPSDINSILDIPFLPIQFFKSHEILSSPYKAEATFTSSGTTGSVTSKHLVTDLSVYEKSFTRGFENQYGSIENYTILALLPSYLERSGSSLIYMAQNFINKSNSKESGFYLDDFSALRENLIRLDSAGNKTLLIGVSFALLDLVEKYDFNLQHTIVMETGGMKGRRKEIIREELHEVLCQGFGVDHIHSEYGMTELLSQAYSKAQGTFTCPPWMQVITRDAEDALTLLNDTKTGGLNVIDLANLNSCSFIATQDLGKVYKDGSFSVLGRFDSSDIRGCNLMAL